MYLKNDLENELKDKIKKNQIKEAIELVEKQIKLDYIKKINKYNKVQYIDIITLKENVEKYLSKKDQVVFKKFFMILNTEINELYQLERLVEIYEILKRGEN